VTSRSGWTRGDLEPGDEISYELPGGKTRTMRLVSVDPLIAPPGMPGNLDRIGAKYTVVQQRAALRQPTPTPVTLPGLHPLISAASGSNIASQHYDDAVFNAFKAVEDRVKKLTGNSDIGKVDDRSIQRARTGTRHHLGQRGRVAEG
jgi:hypothetical protein